MKVGDRVKIINEGSSRWCQVGELVYIRVDHPLLNLIRFADGVELAFADHEVEKLEEA